MKNRQKKESTSSTICATSNLLEQEKRNIAYPIVTKKEKQDSTISPSSPGASQVLSSGGGVGSQAPIGLGATAAAVRGIGKNGNKDGRKKNNLLAANKTNPEIPTLRGLGKNEGPSHQHRGGNGTANTTALPSMSPNFPPDIGSSSSSSSTRSIERDLAVAQQAIIDNEIAVHGDNDVRRREDQLLDNNFHVQTSNRVEVVSDQNLVEALPVEEEEDTRMETAEPVDHEILDQQTVREALEKKNRRRFAFGVMAIACLLLVVASVVVAAAGLPNNQISDNVVTRDRETTAPTGNPTTRPLPPMENLELLYQVLSDGTKESLHNSDSPQYQAWDWLLNHPNITTYPEWRKKQVFAMATFFYAFDGSNWPEETPGCDRWMDVATSECSWVMTEAEATYFYLEANKVVPGAYNPKGFQPCNNNGELQTVILHQLYLPPNANIPHIPPEIELLPSLKIWTILFSDLNNARLSDDLLIPEFLHLPNLVAVNIQSAGVIGAIPKVLSQMTALKHLGIGANKLTGTFPSQIGRMTGLEHFILGDTEGITGTLPSEIGLMTSLAGFEVARNSLTGHIPSELGLLGKMRRIALDGNNFSGAIPDGLWELSKLEWLLLNDLPDVHGGIPSELVMPNLTMLRLSGSSSLIGIIPEDVCFVQELKFDCSDLLCGCSCHCDGAVNGTNL